MAGRRPFPKGMYIEVKLTSARHGVTVNESAVIYKHEAIYNIYR